MEKLIEVPIPQFPDGWKVVRCRTPLTQIAGLNPDSPIYNPKCTFARIDVSLYLEKIEEIKTKARRMVMEETEEDNPSNLDGYFDTQSFDRGSFLIYNQPKKWRVLNEQGESDAK